MKYLLMVFAFIMLMGCDPVTKEKTNGYILPEDLKECKVYYLSNGGSSMNALVCPHANTTTSYQNGKVRYHTSVITGETL